MEQFLLLVGDTGEVPLMGDKSSDNYLNTVVVLIEDVWHQLTTINPGKSGGPDGSHPHALREIKGAITPLYLIFNIVFTDNWLYCCSI